MDNSTHKDILLHLQREGSITGAIAWDKYKCYRLSSVILRLRKDHIIETVMIETTNDYGRKSQYANYVYWGKKEEGGNIFSKTS